jgi:hypothetical protein
MERVKGTAVLDLVKSYEASGNTPEQAVTIVDHAE